jgi:hypothetical protein
MPRELRDRDPYNNGCFKLNNVPKTPRGDQLAVKTITSP